MKKITFVAHNDRTAKIETPPKPSKLFAPTWYKNTKHFNNELGQTNSVMDFVKSGRLGLGLHSTYKMCVPFVDALTSGYTLTLPATIYVHQETDAEGKNVPTLSWKVDWPLVDNPSDLTIPNLPIPYGHNAMFFRWSNNWQIETPIGYSSLITHPANRFDLPFTTMTGIVDTDKQINPIVLPFFIREGFEGEIPMGTPIAQIFPFKRDDWQSEIAHENNAHGHNVVKLTYIRYYKKMLWSKKNYS